MTPSSTSSSEISAGGAPQPPRTFAGGFLSRVVLFFAIVLVISLGVSRGAGLAYRPRPLAPSRDLIASCDHFVALFGNSQFEAAIDSQGLAATLEKPTASVRAQMFTGGGWHALHYYMLALLARDGLRRNRDAVVIEVSPTSLNDADQRPVNVRPEVARQVAGVPGIPVEMQLDVLFGALSPLYRYRLSLRAAVGTALLAPLNRSTSVLEALGLVGVPQLVPQFSVVTAPGRNFVIQDVLGDRSAFRRVAREKAAESLGRMRIGGFKMAALELAVRALREREIAVVLVVTPTAGWFEDLVPKGSSVVIRNRLGQLAKSTGATLLFRWPDALHDDSRFWDGHHMLATATQGFTDELARQLRQVLSW